MIQLDTSEQLVSHPIKHSVIDFGVEAYRPGSAWVSAFNGPIHKCCNPNTGEEMYCVTVRLSRLKDEETKELYSTNLMFYMHPSQMAGIQNIYTLARTTPFTRIRGPLEASPFCKQRPGQIWYDPNPEGVIMEDIRQAPVMLKEGRPGLFVTGQGYRGKVMLPNGKFIHDVGVYGAYLDLENPPAQLELKYLFGGIEFRNSLTGTMEDTFLTEICECTWVKGIIGNAVDEIHVESYKNSVLLPSPGDGKTLIGARSMSETKLLYYFETSDNTRLCEYRLGGFIEGVSHSLGDELWNRVKRIGLGSNFIPCPELDGYLGIIHIVLEKNNPIYPDTMEYAYPDIEEQYEGWFIILKFDDNQTPHITACRRALTPDDIPESYKGAGELFDTKRVAFPVSLYRDGDCVYVGYGWGDRALFLSEYEYDTVISELR